MSDTRPYVPEDAFRLRWLHSASLSPDATRVVYALSEYGAETDSDIVNLWMLDFDGGDEQQFTSGQCSDTSPAWAPDGQTIAFLSDRVDGVTQIFLVPAEGGEAQQLTGFPNGVVGAPVWSPDGSQIAFTARQQHSPPEDPNKPYRVTRNVYRFDGLGYVHRVVNDIYTITLPREAGPVGVDEAVRLTDNDAVNGDLVWSPDGTKVLFTRGLDADTFLSVRPSIATVDMAGNETTVITNDDYAVSAATWHSDGDRIVFAGTPRSKPNGSKADVYVTAVDDGEPANRTASLPMGVCGALQGDMPSSMDLMRSKLIVAPDGASVWCEVQRGGRVEIASVALDGAESVESLAGGDRTVRLLDVSFDNERMLFCSADINQPPELYLRELNDDGPEVERQLTAVNRNVLSGLDQATVRRISFTSVDGVEVEGWHVAPNDDAVAWPTVLSIHGGPHLGFGHNYRFDTHMMLGAGFAVLMINHRASSGYSDEFGTAIIGDWGNLEFHDLMLGVDHVIAKGLCDADRLGVSGLSGGGYLSCWIVGQTDRFKAAVPENPITNWVSSYGAGDASAWLAVEEMGGHPHEVPEVYAQSSPITHAHQCTTPTLLIQGEHDWRCTAEQSEQFYTVLKVNGCEVEMLRLPGSSHIGSIAGPPAIRRAKNEAMLDWLASRVL